MPIRARTLEQMEARRAYSREWYARNAGKAAQYAREYRATHPMYMREIALRKYGVSMEWFRDQLVGQAGRCAICVKVMEPGRKTHVDHDHVSGKPRGLLCDNCNHLLGHAQESTRVLRAAARYLEGVHLDDI